MQNVLIFAPGNQEVAQTHYTTLIGQGLEPKNIVVKTDPLLNEEVVITVNKRHIGKIMTIGVPEGTLQTLIKKFSGLPKIPAIFCLSPDCQPSRVEVKKGFYRKINCPTQLLQ